MTRGALSFLLALMWLLVSCAQPATSPTPMAEPEQPTSAPTDTAIETSAEGFAQFEGELEDLRQQHKIPGFSAAIVQDQELVWAKGFGYADLENKVKATPDTPYRLASLTKPFAATIIMQLVQEDKLDLDDPVSEYGIDIESPALSG